jgi:hypothetical protein
MPNQGNQGDTSNRGFSSTDEEKQREIASKGGKAAHEKGTAMSSPRKRLVKPVVKGDKPKVGDVPVEGVMTAKAAVAVALLAWMKKNNVKLPKRWGVLTDRLRGEIA